MSLGCETCLHLRGPYDDGAPYYCWWHHAPLSRLLPDCPYWMPTHESRRFV